MPIFDNVCRNICENKETIEKIIDASNNNKTLNADIKIPLMDILKPWLLPGQEIIPRPPKESKLTLCVECPNNVYVNRTEEKLVHEIQKHFYKEEDLISCKQTEYKYVESLTSIEECDTQNMITVFNNDKKRYTNKIKRRKIVLEKEFKIIEEIKVCINKNYVNMYELFEYINKQSNENKNAKHFRAIAAILRTNVSIEDKIKRIINCDCKIIDSWYENKYNMNMKTKHQGKHYKSINTKQKRVISSIVLWSQLKDNEAVKNDFYDTILRLCHQNEQYMINYFRNSEPDFYTKPKNRCLEILCNNYILLLIKEYLNTYNEFLLLVKYNLENKPFFVTNDRMAFTKILEYNGRKLLYKLNNNELKDTHWNKDTHSSNDIIFDTIYMINMNHVQSFIKDKDSHDIFNGIGFVIARDSTKHKWNMFPVHDERINYNNFYVGNCDDSTSEYVKTNTHKQINN